MLEITIPEREYYNESTEEFECVEAITLKLEHSLISISKWESRWKVSFLSKSEKTREELIDYIRCMSINQHIPNTAYNALSTDILTEISNYIGSSETATTFSTNDGKKNREIITSELIYYYMIALQIPFECQKWHLNRLLTLIRICNIKNAPSNKKMSKAEILRRNNEINSLRRSALNSKG